MLRRKGFGLALNQVQLLAVGWVSLGMQGFGNSPQNGPTEFYESLDRDLEGRTLGKLSKDFEPCKLSFRSLQELLCRPLEVRNPRMLKPSADPDCDLSTYDSNDSRISRSGSLVPLHLPGTPEP